MAIKGLRILDDPLTANFFGPADVAVPDVKEATDSTCAGDSVTNTEPTQDPDKEFVRAAVDLIHYLIPNGY